MIALVGDADPDELAPLAARAFGELRHAAPRDARRRRRGRRDRRRRVEPRDRAQTALALLFPGPARDDPRRYSRGDDRRASRAGLAAGSSTSCATSGRSCYTVHAFASDRRLAGTFGAYIATSPEQEDAARDGLLAEFRRLRDEPVTAEELERAQTYAIGTHAIRQQSGGAVLARHGRRVSVRVAWRDLGVRRARCGP